MGRNFQRIVRVTAGPRGKPDQARVFGNTKEGGPGHHVRFSTRAGDTGRAGECDLTIYNLSPESVALFEVATNVVKVDVGYREYSGNDGVPNLRTVFAGNPETAKMRYRKSGGDWRLDVLIRDGGHAIDYGRLDVSYSTPTPVSKVITDLAKAMNLATGTIDAGAVPDLRRFVYSGAARDALDMLVCSAGEGRQWFVRDSTLHVMGRGGSTPEQAVVFSSETGNLLEAPTTLEKGGVEFVGMMEPSIRVGCVVKVESKRVTGFYRVTGVAFRGSNYDGAFSVKIKAVRRG
jgi:hypothetical protein